MARNLTSNVDFAALRTLTLVLETGSFTEASRVLGVNQSAVSYTIEKLRRVFQDPLFYRQGSRMEPTDRCIMIAEQAKEMISTINLLAEPPSFDPATAQQTFVISCNYYERLTIIPNLIRLVRKEARGIRLDLITSSARGDHQLKEAQADLLIGPLRPDEAGFFSRKLIDERYVCLMDRDNPLAGRYAISRADYLAANHLVVTYDGNWKSGYLKAIEAEKVQLAQPVSAPSLGGLSELIQGTDLLATVPLRVAVSLSDALEIAECPFPSPFDISLVWTARTHQAASHIWLRNKIVAIAQGLKGE